MYAQQLNSENDASQDGNIRNFIKEYTINSRPYGHGYLAAAYAGYLAGGGGAVTSGNIAAGMNLIFSDLIGGKSLEQTLKDRTGYNSSEINSLFRAGNAGVVEFSRKLAYNSIGPESGCRFCYRRTVKRQGLYGYGRRIDAVEHGRYVDQGSQAAGRSARQTGR